MRLKLKNFNINSDIQTLFTNTYATSEPLNNSDKILVRKILTDVCFYDKRPNNKGNESAQLKEFTDNLPKSIGKISNPLSPQLTYSEIEDESGDLEGQGRKI